MTDVLEPIAVRPSSRKAAMRAIPLEILERQDDPERFEIVDGQLVEKEMGAVSSYVGRRVGGILGSFCDRNPVGWVLEAETGYRCFPEQPTKLRRPDVSVILLGRFVDELMPEGYITIAPDLAVEVISPNDLYVTIEERLSDYLAAGSKSVWVVNPASRSVRIHKPDGSARSLQSTDTLTDPDVLPGFSTVVEEFFRPPAGVVQTAPRGSTAPATVDSGANP